MNKYMPILMRCPLFTGIAEADIEKILPCLSAAVRHYDKNTFILSAGDSFSSVGLVLSGSVQIVSEDYWGRKDILSHVEPGELFGESFSFTQAEIIPVSVVCAEDCDVMLLNCGKIIRTCTSACDFHAQLTANMLQVIANKNIFLMQKIEQLSKRTTREKLLAYLSSVAKETGRNAFVIPFSRQELADYLSVDRSAMSSELSKMRDEGILDFNRSRFILI